MGENISAGAVLGYFFALVFLAQSVHLRRVHAQEQRDLFGNADDENTAAY